jgi:phosphatidylserine/phosphatidylglycerophosphate/cardiolipin synthase-like enzyme
MTLFSGCTDAIVSATGQAKMEILVQAYSLTSAPIVKALVDAHKRGVYVQIILDQSQRKERYSSADFTAHAGLPTYIDAVHAIAHNKVMVLDKAVVITGSFNFTKATVTNNEENLLVIRSKELANTYGENWQRHKEYSERYAGRQAGHPATLSNQITWKKSLTNGPASIIVILIRNHSW